MSAWLIAILVGVALVFFGGVLVWLGQRSVAQLKTQWTSEFRMESDRLRQELQQFNQNLSMSMTETRQSVQSDLKSSSTVMTDIHRRLGELSAASRRIHEVGKDIAGLEELLRSPKLRGGMGEYFLEDLLGQIIPQRFFEMQHAFRSGCIVDAVIRVGESMLCIDSKFPLEAYRELHAEADEDKVQRSRSQLFRQVRKHIDDIAAKYILPAEGTYDFALMYIPAERVYYETFVRPAEHSGEGVFEYAIKKKVIPVSPNSIYAYLQVILVGLRGFEVEKHTKEILSKLSGLQIELRKFEGAFRVVGKHLSNTSKKFEEAQNHFTRLEGHVRLIDEHASEHSSLPDEKKSVALNT